jgi:hypothetical protein
MNSAQTYLDLIPSQNRAQPKFTAMMTALVQPFVDGQSVLAGMPSLFDIDSAVGVQLDVVGQWVGISRNLSTPINTYFAWDTAGVGWDQGAWKRPSDPIVGLVVLDDTHFRAVLKAKALNNHWDGDAADAYAIMNATFSVFGYSIGIEDYGNLTMGLLLIGLTPPDDTLLALFNSGLLDIRPVGVQIVNRTYLNAPALLGSSFVLDASQLA